MASNHASFRIEPDEFFDVNELQASIEREMFRHAHVVRTLTRSQMVRVLLQLNGYGRPPADAQERELIEAARRVLAQSKPRSP